VRSFFPSASTPNETPTRPTKRSSLHHLRRGHFRRGPVSREAKKKTVRLMRNPTWPDPKSVLVLDCYLWRIEIMHQDRDLFPGEDV